MAKPGIQSKFRLVKEEASEPRPRTVPRQGPRHQVCDRGGPGLGAGLEVRSQHLQRGRPARARQAQAFAEGLASTARQDQKRILARALLALEKGALGQEEGLDRGRGARILHRRPRRGPLVESSRNLDLRRLMGRATLAVAHVRKSIGRWSPLQSERAASRCSQWFGGHVPRR